MERADASWELEFGRLGDFRQGQSHVSDMVHPGFLESCIGTEVVLHLLLEDRPSGLGCEEGQLMDFVRSTWSSRFVLNLRSTWTAGTHIVQPGMSA